MAFGAQDLGLCVQDSLPPSAPTQPPHTPAGISSLQRTFSGRAHRAIVWHFLLGRGQAWQGPGFRSCLAPASSQVWTVPRPWAGISTESLRKPLVSQSVSQSTNTGALRQLRLSSCPRDKAVVMGSEPRNHPESLRITDTERSSNSCCNCGKTQVTALTTTTLLRTQLSRTQDIRVVCERHHLPFPELPCLPKWKVFQQNTNPPPLPQPLAPVFFLSLYP